MMKTDVLKISFQPCVLAPIQEEPESFSFLGLKGDFVIYVDKVTHFPVQVNGKISTFIKVDIKLQETIPADFARKYN